MEQGRISGVMEECIMEPGSLTSGKGTFSWPDGRQYIGDYVDDKTVCSNGRKYDG